MLYAHCASIYSEVSEGSPLSILFLVTFTSQPERNHQSHPADDKGGPQEEHDGHDNNRTIPIPGRWTCTHTHTQTHSHAQLFNKLQTELLPATQSQQQLRGEGGSAPQQREQAK